MSLRILVMPRCFISLGGNLGAVGETFGRALDRLAQAPGTTIDAVSRFHQTEPVGERTGSAFLNAAAAIDTALAPLELLDLLQSIETDLGRVRTIRWGPRTLDLDLVFYGSEIIDWPRLVVPHPSAWYRRFVLDPLVEIAPHFVDPERQVDLETLRDRLLPRPLVAALAGGLAAARSSLVRRLAAEFPEVNFVEWKCGNQRQPLSERNASLVFWLGTDRQSGAAPAFDFTELPRVARIDVTKTSEPVEDFVRHVLKSALA
jgi:2-amino-4-hydroxy-6-hydroxymethyldihydropteridine diphosphokinase